MARVKTAGRLAKLDPQWAGRRRYLWLLTLFAMSVIVTVLGRGLDTAPADTAMTMAFSLLIMLSGSYIFGAAWERISGVPGGNAVTVSSASSSVEGLDEDGNVVTRKKVTQEKKEVTTEKVATPTEAMPGEGEGP